MEQHRAGTIEPALPAVTGAHPEDDIAARDRARYQGGDDLRRVHVGEHHDHIISDDRLEARGDRDVRPETPREPQHADARATVQQARHPVDRIVLRAVIDQDQLVVLEVLLQDRNGLADERLDDGRIILDRSYHGNKAIRLGHQVTRDFRKWLMYSCISNILSILPPRMQMMLGAASTGLKRMGRLSSTSL